MVHHTGAYSEISDVEGVEDADDSTRLGESNLIEKHSNQNITIRTSSLKLYALGFAVFNILALLVLHFQIQSHCKLAPGVENDLPITKLFLSNFSYMSLDHKYDNLWSDQVSYPLHIFSSKGIKSGENQEGVITM